MYRFRQLLTVSDSDGWNEVVAVFDEAQKLAESRGWARGTLFTRTVGRFNELCLEIEYPDLATMQREQADWFAEPGIGELMRRLDSVKMEDIGYSELWEEASRLPE